MFTGSREIPKPSAQKTFANRFLVRVPFRFHGGPKLLTGRTQKLLHAGKGILGMGCPLIIQPYIYTLYSGYVLGICISPFTGLLWGGLKKTARGTTIPRVPPFCLWRVQQWVAFGVWLLLAVYHYIKEPNYVSHRIHGNGKNTYKKTPTFLWYFFVIVHQTFQ